MEVCHSSNQLPMTMRAAHQSMGACSAQMVDCDPNKRITIWNKAERRKVSGNAAPKSKNLRSYLDSNPHCEVFVDQDRDVPPGSQVRRRVNRVANPMTPLALPGSSSSKQDTNQENLNSPPSPTSQPYSSVDPGHFSMIPLSPLSEQHFMSLDLSQGEDDDDWMMDISRSHTRTQFVPSLLFLPFFFFPLG
eukprot:c12541_g1_i2.p1 GENE.c12541_g1_i2~~c12541_g1_i2.p1  ORF type:complete len:204 (-),score=46.73 c12541_g1_i2:32-604(-)